MKPAPAPAAKPAQATTWRPARPSARDVGKLVTKAAVNVKQIAALAREDIALIKERMRRMISDFYDIAEALTRLKRPEVFAALGYSRFRELVEKELGMSGTKADELVAIATNVSREVAESLGHKGALSIVSLAGGEGHPCGPEGKETVTRALDELGRGESGGGDAEAAPQSGSRACRGHRGGERRAPWSGRAHPRRADRKGLRVVRRFVWEIGDFRQGLSDKRARVCAITRARLGIHARACSVPPLTPDPAERGGAAALSQDGRRSRLDVRQRRPRPRRQAQMGPLACAQPGSRGASLCAAGRAHA